MRRLAIVCLFVWGVLGAGWAQAVTATPPAVRAKQVSDLKWGMFMCWSFSTFSGKEWTREPHGPEFFKATGCDTDQWCQTAKEAGMGYILFLAKHHDGFCLWDTKTTDLKVTNSPLKRDVLAQLRKSCDKFGIKLALYFSEGDWPMDRKKATAAEQAELKKAQLKELLTQYGPIEYLWFDRAQGTGGLSHPDTAAWCKQFQPDCLVGFNHGEKAGDIQLGEHGKPGPVGKKTGIGSDSGDRAYANYLVAEFTYPILPKGGARRGGADWFYSLPIHDDKCLPAEKLYQDYLGAVKYGNLFSIDVGPNTAGKIRDIDVKTLREVGRRIRGEPYSTLNPPKGITPAQTRGAFPYSFPGCNSPTNPGRLPARTWTPEERRQYEARTQWFHEAKFGVFFHFLAFGDASRGLGMHSFWPKDSDWTSEQWNQAVDAVDVERFADQAKELGVGYVVITLGQWHKYACAPNPVIDELWGLKPGQYNARRDLPMELGKALEKRGIAMMLYGMVQKEHGLPTPKGWTQADKCNNWIKVMQWYSDHYGKLCKGWWIDGLGTVEQRIADQQTAGRQTDGAKENWYLVNMTQALKHGNPDALVGSGVLELSDYTHGHCRGAGEWQTQRQLSRPFFGRWDPECHIQWQSLLYLGTFWGACDTPKKTDEVAAYAADIVKGGGVITFDVGAYKIVNGKTVPSLEIHEAQAAQLRAVRDAVKSIPVSDGSGMTQLTTRTGL